MPSFKTANKDDVLKSGFVFVKDSGTQTVKKIATASAFQVGLTGVPSSLVVTGNLSLAKVSFTIAGGSTTTITQNISFVGVSSTGSGTAKIKLPPGQAVGQIIYIKDEAGNAVDVNIQIDPSPAKIDGATTKTINRNYGFFQLIWNGTEWNVIAQPAPTGAGTGDVSGPGSSTDNAVVRWNGTDGENIKNSGVIIDNSDNLSVPGDIAANSGYLTTTVTHGRLFNTTATTVSIAGAASTALNIGNTSSTNNTISGRTKFPQGLSGSLTRLTDGTTYMIAGNNITITSASNGAVTISSTAGGGDVTGPASSTDNAIARFDLATGKVIQNSGVTIDDSDNLVVPGDVTVSGGKITLTNGSTIDSETVGKLILTEDLVEITGDLKVSGNDIQASDGNVNITMTSNTLTEIKGDLQVSGNDIKSSGGTTSLTLSSADVTVAGDLTVSGGKVTLTNGSIIDSETVDVLKLTESDVRIIGQILSTDQTTFNLINSTATTLNIGGAASAALNIGNTSSTNNTISGKTKFPQGLSGSLTRLTDGTSYMIAGNNITITTSSLNGAVTISSIASGDVTGPASSTDNAVARFDLTTGKLLQNSGVTIDDSDNLVVPGDVTVSGGKITLTNGSVIDSETVDVLKLTESDVRIIGQTLSTDQATFNLINSTATSLNIGGAATGVVIGAIASSTTNIRGGTLIGNTTTQNLFNTTATTLNIGGAASTALNIGNTSSTNNTISGRTKFPQGLSGSLTQLTDGTSYIIAGNNITITSASNGAVTINSAGGAPASAQYLVLSANSSLSDERVFVPSTGLTATNAGTDGGNYTLAINDSVVATVSGTQFRGTVGVTGSLGSTTLTVVSGVLYHANGVIKQNSNFIYDEDSRFLGVGMSSTPQANLHGNSTFRLGTTNYIALDNSLSTTHSRWSSGGAKTTIDMDVDQTFAQGSMLGFSQGFSNTQLDLGLTWAAKGILSVSGSAPGAILRFNATSTPLAAGDLGMNISTGRPNAFIGGAVRQLAHTDEVVVGPASSTDNAIARYDLTTGKLLQDSGVTIDDSNNVVIPGDLAVNGAGSADITTTNALAASLFNTNVLAISLGGAATSITMGATAGTTTVIRGGTLVGNTTTQDLFNTTATTLNIGGAASTALNIGNASSTNNTVSGRTKFPQGLSGSLTRLTDDTSYMIAGNNITITSASNGAVTISSIASGDVTGPASSTDNAVARFDLTTGKLIQNSGVTIDDSNNVVIPGDLAVSGGDITTSASTFNLLNGTSTPSAINIGTTELTAGVNTITIGKKTTTGNKGTKLYLYGGDGAAGSIDIDTGGSGIYIGNGTSAKAIEIGSNASTANSIVIGSNYLSSQLSLLGGRTSNPGLILSASVIEVGKQVGSGYLYLGRQALSGNIDIGESAIDTTITIGKNAITSEVTNPSKRTYIKIGPGATNSEINIGDSSVSEIFTYSKNTSWIDTWANPTGGDNISSIKIGCLNFQRIIKIGHPGEDNASDVSGQSEKQQVYLGSSGSASWTEIYGGFSSTPNPGVERASYGGIMLSASFIEITGSYPKANLGTDATIGAVAIGSLPGTGHNGTAIFVHRELGSFSTNYALKQKKDGLFDGETWLNAASGQTIYFGNGGNVVGYIDNSSVSLTGGSVATTTTLGNTTGASSTAINAGTGNINTSGSMNFYANPNGAGYPSGPAADFPIVVRATLTGSVQRWGIAIDNTGKDLLFSWNENSTTLLNRGYLLNQTDVSNIDFTGQHRNCPATGSILDFSDKIGMIVVSSGQYKNLTSDPPSVLVNEALPTVYLSSIRNQKSVFGVISDHEDPNETARWYEVGNWGSVYEKAINDDRLVINSLGEGGIWVCNINGNLENGDYITTCEIPGYGMKQDDDLLHNYTVAKITMNCDFTLNNGLYRCEEFQHEGVTYRRAFAGCTYHCG